MSETYVHLGRIAVITQIILVPLYFLLLSVAFFHIDPLPFLDEQMTNILLHITVMVLFSFPILVWTYAKRYQLSDAYELLGGRVWRLPVSIKAFYGLNFVIAVIFILPFAAPLITLLLGYFLGLAIWEDEDRHTRKHLILSGIVFILILPLVLGFFLTVGRFLSDVIEFWTYESNLNFIYSSCINLADAATFGGILYLYFEGARQVDYSVEVPGGLISLISAAIFISLEGALIVLTPTGDTRLIDWIHIGAVIIGVGIVALRFYKGLGRSSEDSSLGGWFSLLLFQAINFASGELELMAKTTAIGVAFVFFSTLFILSYRKAGSRF